MAEEPNSVASTKGVDQEVTGDSISLDTSLTPEPRQDLSAFSLSGISGTSVDDRKQAGQGPVISFVSGKEISQGVEGGSELLQQEYGVSEVALGVATFLNNQRFSRELQEPLLDYFFSDSRSRNLEVIKAWLGDSITPEDPDLQKVRDLAEGYFPKNLPGDFCKHRLPSLSHVNEGEVASAIAEDVQSVRALATSQRGPQGIVRDDIAERWELLKTAARAAA